jgi:hypothetical protein
MANLLRTQPPTWSLTPLFSAQSSASVSSLRQQLPLQQQLLNLPLLQQHQVNT